MGWIDSVLSNTVGVAFRAVTGSVDPWTLQQIKDDTAAQIAQAAGPDADPADVAAAQAAASSAIDSNLLSQHAHPSQAGVRIPGLGVVGSADFLVRVEHLVYGAIAVLGIGGALYFALKYRKVLKGTFKL
jgi:hypothetical protein